MTDILETCQGDAVSVNPQIPYIAMIRGPWWDVDGRQRAERINGCVVCPDCGLLWPLREEVEAWIKKDGRWYASEWGPGAAECIECGLVMVDGFDGCHVLRPHRREDRGER